MALVSSFQGRGSRLKYNLKVLFKVATFCFARRPEHEIYVGNYPVRFREGELRSLFEEHQIKVSTIRMKNDGLKV